MNKIWLYGLHCVKSIILESNRSIDRILCTNKSLDEIRTAIVASSKGNGLLNKIDVVDKSIITNQLDSNKNHQNVAILCSKNPLISSDELISQMDNVDIGNIVVLDQLSDPQNIGSIIRSAAAFGLRNIVVPETFFPGETATMVKAASGNYEKVRIYIAPNINSFLQKIKKYDYWCIGLAGESNADITHVKGFEKAVLVIGSEGGGIRPLVKKNCDMLVRIAMERNVESLNVANAASIAFYELHKCRK